MFCYKSVSHSTCTLYPVYILVLSVLYLYTTFSKAKRNVSAKMPSSVVVKILQIIKCNH